MVYQKSLLTSLLGQCWICVANDICKIFCFDGSNNNFRIAYVPKLNHRHCVTSAHGLSGNLKKRHILPRYRPTVNKRGKQTIPPAAKLNLEISISQRISSWRMKKYQSLFSVFVLWISLDIWWCHLASNWLFGRIAICDLVMHETLYNLFNILSGDTLIFYWTALTLWIEEILSVHLIFCQLW